MTSRLVVPESGPASPDSGRPRSDATRLHVLQGGGEWALASLFDPSDPACGDALYLPYYYYVVDHPRGLVVVDCGVHPELAADPAGRLGRSTCLPDIRMSPEDDLAAQLGRIGATPADVQHVVLTHLHYDHCGGLSAMPAATVHLQRAELEFAENPPVYQRDAYVPADWAVVANWALHDGGHDLFGDDSITMLPTPGHTPGHQSVLVKLPDRKMILAGDAIYHPGKTADRRLPGYLWNPDKLVASWELIESLAALHAAEVMLSHYPADAAALSGAAGPPPRSHG